MSLDRGGSSHDTNNRADVKAPHPPPNLYTVVNGIIGQLFLSHSPPVHYGFPMRCQAILAVEFLLGISSLRLMTTAFYIIRTDWGPVLFFSFWIGNWFYTRRQHIKSWLPLAKYRSSLLSRSNFTMMSNTFTRLLTFSTFALCTIAASVRSSDCTGSISSLDDVDDAVACTTVNINSFTVPAGETFNLDLLTGTTVNMCAWLAPSICPAYLVDLLIVGDVTFGNKTWAGPLFQVR